MEPAPFFNDIAQGPPDGQAWWMMSTDGQRLRGAFWPGGQRGTVLILPGRTEYIERYGCVANALMQRGFSTLTLDYRGQGLSDRLMSPEDRGHIGEFQDYQLDVAAMLRLAKHIDCPKPFFLFASSMGGCIALRALHDGLPVNAAVINAPMWGIAMSGAERFAARTIGALFQNTAIGQWRVPSTPKANLVLSQPFDGNPGTRSAEMYNYLQDQARALPQMTVTGPSFRWLYQALSEIDTLTAMRPPDVPTVTFLGTDEDTIDPVPVHDMMQVWPNGRLVIIPGARHEVFLDLPDVRTAFYNELELLFTQNGATG